MHPRTEATVVSSTAGHSAAVSSIRARLGGGGMENAKTVFRAMVRALLFLARVRSCSRTAALQNICCAAQRRAVVMR